MAAPYGRGMEITPYLSLTTHLAELLAALAALAAVLAERRR